MFKLTRIIRWPIAIILTVLVISQLIILILCGLFLHLLSDDVFNCIDAWFDIQLKTIKWLWL